MIKKVLKVGGVGSQVKSTTLWSNPDSVPCFNFAEDLHIQKV